MGKVLELDTGDGYLSVCDCQNALKGYVLLYINYISIKFGLLKKFLRGGE